MNKLKSKMKYHCTLKDSDKKCWFTINADDKDLVNRKRAHERYHSTFGFADGGLRNNIIGEVEWVLK